MASIGGKDYFEILRSVAVENPQNVYVMDSYMHHLGTTNNSNTFQRYANVIESHGFDSHQSTIFITDFAYLAGEDFGELEAFLEVLPNGEFRYWDMNGRLID